MKAVEMRDAWGKIDQETGIFHPLAHHCMDVAAVFASLVRLPIVADRLNQAAGQQIDKAQLDRLSALVFLHDVGKLHPGFQAKGWPQGTWQAPRRGHLAEGWNFLILATQASEHPFHQSMSRILQWGDESVVSDLFAAVLAHHGRPVACLSDPTISDWDNLSSPEFDWRAETNTLRGVMMQWFGEAFGGEAGPLPKAARFHHEVAGLVVLADWLGSNEHIFKYSSPLDVEYRQVAQERAACALEMFRPNADLLAARPAPDFTKLTGYASPNPAQAVAGAVEPTAKLVILEAETGSGKTEAALWRFAQLLAVGKVSSLYFAVPTRAAARQLHGRVVEAMQRVFGDDAPEAVLAIPGMLCAGEFDGHRLPGWKVRWDDDRVEVPERWAAERASRFLAATVAVGTVDQALLAGLTVKYAHLRGSVLGHSLLVVDEVHASDSYMTEILARLLDGHLAVGGYAMLMSATLGARARARWADGATPDFAEASDTPYPAVWIKGEAAPRAVRGTWQSKTVTLQSVPTMDEEVTARRAIECARRGARVLVVRNTVEAAVATWNAVRGLGAASLLMRVNGAAALHHSRFAAEDRFLLDKAVESILGSHDSRRTLGCIVIGTQTLEQSLDIDADFLITDLCPVDVLLQRIGRLHRHPRLQRPSGFASACCAVLMPEEGLDRLAEPKFENGLGAWIGNEGIHGIYLDLAALELTRRLVVEQPEWQIPKMNRALVEEATHPERIGELLAEKGEVWSRYESKIGGSKLAQTMIAKLNALDRTARFQELIFPDEDTRIMTRLGEEGIVLTLDDPVIGPFGSRVSRIALPARWSRGLRGDEKIAVETQEDGLVLSADERCFLYTREGLRPKS